MHAQQSETTANCETLRLRQASQAGTALSSLYRSIYVAVHRPTQTPVRYIGVFTDGGAEKALRQYGVDNMCAPVAHCPHQLTFASHSSKVLCA